MSKVKYARGEMRKIAIDLINANPTMHEGEIAPLIASTLNIKLCSAIHNYYRLAVMKGLTNVKAIIKDPTKVRAKRVTKVKAPKVTKTAQQIEGEIVQVLTKAAAKPATPKVKVSADKVKEFQAGLARAEQRAAEKAKREADKAVA